ncbi:DUF4867 family protein [Ruminococcus albus]|uniref:DUF4867 domain-containing protein n=1 Tax=Ruminococcus albus (strain ATCC 27210 / DSM 20455 / JCM 14654 / NCDO 2250 / 7) TaxID=697329 RepID=E6UDX8_RUMA7|nr:DUF4867 family protein [Ruminococcus albus]ADU21765.1 hypothetical protein Rumal_1249 [Ruminococcus albus 7 = DSM 20455]
MKIYSVNDPEFREFGKVLEGYDTKELIAAMNAVEMPADGVAYEPWIDSLEKCGIFKSLENNAFGGMPIELGMCWGHNKLLNCLEYHRNSEINIGATDFVLLLAKQEKIIDGVLDTADVKAFRAPAGAVVEVYATSLHYAPCQTEDGGFRVAIVLPRNTNTDLAKGDIIDSEDKTLWARNKWLLAHADSAEAKQGAYIGLKGENISI